LQFRAAAIQIDWNVYFSLRADESTRNAYPEEPFVFSCGSITLISRLLSTTRSLSRVSASRPYRPRPRPTDRIRFTRLHAGHCEYPTGARCIMQRNASAMRTKRPGFSRQAVVLRGCTGMYVRRLYHDTLEECVWRTRGKRQTVQAIPRHRAGRACIGYSASRDHISKSL